MDPGPVYMEVRILYNTYRKWTTIDYGPGSIFYGGPYSMAHIQDMDPYRIWTSGSKLYGISIENMDPGSIFHGVHILYDTVIVSNLGSLTGSHPESDKTVFLLSWFIC